MAYSLHGAVRAAVENIEAMRSQRICLPPGHIWQPAPSGTMRAGDPCICGAEPRPADDCDSEWRAPPDVPRGIHAAQWECLGVHCSMHNVDEYSGDVICLECGHAFADERALLRAAVRVALQCGLPVPRRARDIDACPFCTHSW